MTKGQSGDDAVTRHMVAEATLAAHFVDAAVRAGMDRAAINAVLSRVADETVISEFWVSDENGEIAFTNVEGANFAFPTDPSENSQAAPFAALLTRSRPSRPTARYFGLRYASASREAIRSRVVSAFLSAALPRFSASRRSA